MRLASVPTWEKLEAGEIKRLLDEEPELAFEDTRKSGANGRPALLRYATNAKDGRHVVLTEEGKTELLERLGHTWFRRVQKDPDGITREYVVRHLPAPGGAFIEASLTLYGMGWPLVEDALEDFEKTAKGALLPESHQPKLPLFDAAEEKVKAKAGSRLQFSGALKDAPVLMNAILAEFGAHGKSPVVFTLEVLRHILKCEKLSLIHI